MTIDAFILNFVDLFDETDESLFKPETEFRQLPEWSSMTALGLIGMIDVEYGVSISGIDIQNCKTIQDIFDLVEERK